MSCGDGRAGAGPAQSVSGREWMCRWGPHLLCRALRAGALLQGLVQAGCVCARETRAEAAPLGVRHSPLVQRDALAGALLSLIFRQVQCWHRCLCGLDF